MALVVAEPALPMRAISDGTAGPFHAAFDDNVCEIMRRNFLRVVSRVVTDQTDATFSQDLDALH